MTQPSQKKIKPRSSKINQSDLPQLKLTENDRIQKIEASPTTSRQPQKSPKGSLRDNKMKGRSRPNLASSKTKLSMKEQAAPQGLRKSNSRSRTKLEDLNYLTLNVEDPDSVFQPGGGESVESIMEKTVLIEAKASPMQREFASLALMKGSSKMAFEKAPSDKNRYLDIPCIDNNRVVLKNSQDGNEYIHANYVDGYKHSNAYICCQGPKDDTAHDFWHMVWQEDTFVIAMLTKCIEGNKIKCFEYWPMIPNTSVTFGTYTVHCTNKNIRAYYEYTELVLTRSDQTEERLLVHVLFTAWPDNDIPDHVRKFLNFVDLVRRTQKGLMEKYHIIRHSSYQGHPLGPPIIVHCSAGIGRTGTFCAIDICCRKLLDTGLVDVQEIIRLIRTQRTMAVQKIEQYLFVYFSIICFAKTTRILQVRRTDE